MNMTSSDAFIFSSRNDVTITNRIFYGSAHLLGFKRHLELVFQKIDKRNGIFIVGFFSSYCHLGRVEL